MASIIQDGNLFRVSEARRITANMTLFSPDPSVKNCTYAITFSLAPASATAAAPAPTALVSSLSRVVPGGTIQTSSIVVSTAVPKASPVTVPLGVFPGRRVQYYVDDSNNATRDRTVVMSIESLDGAGANESWRHQVAAIIPAGTRTNYVVAGPPLQAPPTPMSIDTVDMIP